MTTVAWDGRTLAADRQSTAGCTRGTCTKIHQVSKNKYVAGAGDLVEIMQVVEWMRREGRKSSAPRVEDSFFLVLDKMKGTCYFMDGRLFRVDKEPILAIGSGSDFALGAMHAGATAKQAVEIASKLDVYTGGGVDIVETNQPKRKQKP